MMMSLTSGPGSAGALEGQKYYRGKNIPEWFSYIAANKSNDVFCASQNIFQLIGSIVKMMATGKMMVTIWQNVNCRPCLSHFDVKAACVLPSDTESTFANSLRDCWKTNTPQAFTMCILFPKCMKRGCRRLQQKKYDSDSVHQLLIFFVLPSGKYLRHPWIISLNFMFILTLRYTQLPLNKKGQHFRVTSKPTDISRPDAVRLFYFC